MNANQKKLLDSIPVKRHDPDGVTAKMVMERIGCGHARASEILRDKIASGDAVACWVKQGARMVAAMKLK